MWANQVAAWVGLVIMAKAVVVVFIFSFIRPLSAVGAWIFMPLDHLPKTKLVLVMLILPFLMNGVQFWVRKKEKIDKLLLAGLPRGICSSKTTDMLLLCITDILLLCRCKITSSRWT